MGPLALLWRILVSFHTQADEKPELQAAAGNVHSQIPSRKNWKLSIFACFLSPEPRGVPVESACVHIWKLLFLLNIVLWNSQILSPIG